jgi:hypothetical protein
MDNQNRQSLTSLPPASQKLALSESKESKHKLDEMLGACLALQKLYGRDVANAGTIIDLFQRMMANYPADKVIRAFELWMERSQEFPTPADIVSLIKRNGKPPLKESDIIAIRKKEVCDWTRAEGEMVEEWNRQQMEGWRDLPDQRKDEATLQENIRLRQKVRALEADNTRLAGLLQEARAAKGLEVPKPSAEDKIAATIAFLKEHGSTDSDIEEFKKSMVA